MNNEIIRLGETDYLAFKAHWICLGTLCEVEDEQLLSQLNAVRARQIDVCGDGLLRTARTVKSVNPGLAAACCDLYLETCKRGTEAASVFAMGTAAKRKLLKHAGDVQVQAFVDETERKLSEDPWFGDGGAVQLSLAGLCLDLAERALKGGKKNSAGCDSSFVNEQLIRADAFLDDAREAGARGFAAKSVAERLDKLSRQGKHLSAA